MSAGRAFVATILLLAAATIGLVGIALVRPSPQVGEEAIPRVQPSPGTLGRIVAEAAVAADARTAAVRAEVLDAVFTPVHDAVPAYADLHYSVVGEYSELAILAFGSLEERLRRHLYDGFDDRLGSGLFRIESAWANAFQDEIDKGISAEIGYGAMLDDLSRATFSDLGRRAYATVPLGTVALTAGGVAGAKALAGTTMKVTAKTVGKTALKTAGKASGLGGMAGGAMIGAALGPVGMAVGGAIGGVVAWFAVDKAVIEADEWLNRTAFEAELHRLIDEHRLGLVAAIDETLELRGAALVTGTLRDRLNAAR